MHRELGPGLLESCYEACLAYELFASGLKVERQKLLPVRYRGTILDCGYRIDLLVNDAIIVEVKSIDQLAPIHEAQVISYLRLSNLSLALLINFNVRLLKDGLKRIVNNFGNADSNGQERKHSEETKVLA